MEQFYIFTTKCQVSAQLHFLFISTFALAEIYRPKQSAPTNRHIFNGYIFL